MRIRENQGRETPVYIAIRRTRQILFIGAPFGSFFGELASAIESRGGRVWRAVTQGGEFVETPRHCRIVMRRPLDDWQDRIEEVMRRRDIDTIVTFNDALPLSRKALDVAERLQVRRFVLENGYLRPFWVTLERDGANGYSRLPRDLSVYLSPEFSGAASVEHVAFRTGFRPHVKNTMMHFAAAAAMSPMLPFDPKYYGDSIWSQAQGYVSEAIWRAGNDESEAIDRLQTFAKTGRRIFLCLMQKPGDKQLVVHSEYGGNVRFLDEVIRCFAACAPDDAVMAVKQHPLDYGAERCPEQVATLARCLGVADRIIYLRKTTIDAVMPLAKAVLTINSTAGLAAMVEGLPVICLGRAFYAIPGLTFEGSLAEFWSDPRPPRPDAVRGFVAYLKSTSQINGGFHTPEGRSLLTPKVAGILVDDPRR